MIKEEREEQLAPLSPRSGTDGKRTKGSKKSKRSKEMHVQRSLLAVYAGRSLPTGCERAARRRGASRSPAPYASQHGDKPSAFASASSLARFGRLSPASVERTSTTDAPARRPSSRIDSPSASRASRSRSGRPAHCKPSDASHGCSIPNASVHGDRPRALASRSTVSTRGTFSPASSAAVVVRLTAPAPRASAECDSPAALRACRNRRAKPKCRGLGAPRTTSLGNTRDRWHSSCRPGLTVTAGKYYTTRQTHAIQRMGINEPKKKRATDPKIGGPIARVGFSRQARIRRRQEHSMCFTRPATSVSRRRRSFSPSSPPKIAALLDLHSPDERAAHDFIRRASSGRWPMWRVFGMRRRGAALFLAVEWRHYSADQRYAMAEVALDQIAVS